MKDQLMITFVEPMKVVTNAISLTEHNTLKSYFDLGYSIVSFHQSVVFNDRSGTTKVAITVLFERNKER